MSLTAPYSIFRSTGFAAVISIALNGEPLPCDGCDVLMSIRDYPGGPLRLALSTKQATALGSSITWHNRGGGSFFVDLKPADAQDTGKFAPLDLASQGYSRGYAADILVVDSSGRPLIRQPIGFPFTFFESVT